MEHTFLFFEDAGHGWLRVRPSLIMKLGVEDKISGYSYMTDSYAYLEEDCDAPAFLEALEASGDNYGITRSYSETSPIRDYGRYNPKYFGGLKLNDEFEMSDGKYKVISVLKLHYIVENIQSHLRRRLNKDNFTDYIL